MVLASSGDMSLEALATLADKVMEVASPSVSSVNVAPLTSEVGQLMSEGSTASGDDRRPEDHPQQPSPPGAVTLPVYPCRKPLFQQSCSTNSGG